MDVFLSPQVAMLVHKATSDDHAPTPGYLYIELAKMTEKSQTTCVSVLESLLGRLRKSSPFVRRKALRCMKHLLLQGNAAPAFRAALLPHADSALRPCLAASGPPDPTFGDEPFASVRRDAADLLDALYRPAPALPSASSASVAPVTAISGPEYTPPTTTAATGSSGGGGGGGHSAVGGLLSSMRSKIASLGSQQDRGSSNYGLPPASLPTLPDLYTAPAVAPRSPATVSSSQQQPQRLTTPTTATSPTGGSGSSASIEGDVLSVASGRDAPTQEELAALVRRTRTASAQQLERAYGAISDALNLSLANSARKQLRALAAIEALVAAQAPGAKSFFSLHSAAAIALLGDSPNAQLQAKALKVLAAVIKPTPAVATSSTIHPDESGVPPVRSLVDLLNGSNEEVPALEVSHAPADLVGTSGSGGGMFSGLETTGEQEHKPKAPQSSSLLLDLGEQPPPATAPPAAPAPAPAPAPAAQPDLLAGLELSPAQPPASSSLDFLTPTPAKPQQQPSAAGALDFLTVADTPAASKPHASGTAFSFLAEAPAPATAFSFLDGSAPGASAAPQPAIMPQSQASAFLFTASTSSPAVAPAASKQPSAFSFL